MRMRFAAIACLVGLLGLWACSAGRRQPATQAPYCLGQVRDGIGHYLVENSEAVADAVSRDEVFLLRDYDNEEFRIARRSDAACGAEEVRISADDLQVLINDSVTHGHAPTGEPCSVSIPPLDPHENAALFQHLGASGIRGPTVIGLGDGGSVQAWDECAVVEAMTTSLLRRSGRP